MSGLGPQFRLFPAFLGGTAATVVVVCFSTDLFGLLRLSLYLLALFHVIVAIDVRISLAIAQAVIFIVLISY